MLCCFRRNNSGTTQNEQARSVDPTPSREGKTAAFVMASPMPGRDGKEFRKKFFSFLYRKQPEPSPNKRAAIKPANRIREMSSVFTAGRLPGVINPECPVPVK